MFVNKSFCALNGVSLRNIRFLKSSNRLNGDSRTASQSIVDTCALGYPPHPLVLDCLSMCDPKRELD